MKILLLILFLFSANHSFGNRKPEKYFLMNNGTKQNFTKFDYIAADTLFFINGTAKNYILVDSIKGLHVYSPSHALGAGIVGFFAGALFGTMLGVAIAPKNGGFSQLGAIEAGVVVGCVAGATLGIIAGESDKVKINFDLEKYEKQQRLNILPSLLKGL